MTMTRTTRLVIILLAGLVLVLVAVLAARLLVHGHVDTMHYHGRHLLHLISMRYHG